MINKIILFASLDFLYRTISFMVREWKPFEDTMMNNVMVYEILHGEKIIQLSE